MADDQKIHLATRGIGGNPPTKGLQICINHGEMDYNVQKGRTPRVKIQPTFIQFQKGSATIDPSMWPKLLAPTNNGGLMPAKSRAEAIEALKVLGGYGTDFFIVGQTDMAGTREPVGAAK